MLLRAAALALQLACGAIAAAFTQTPVDESVAGIFPRETGLFGLASTCTSVLIEVTPIPLPPQELMELLVRLNAKGGDPCSFSFVSSMAAAYTSYQSEAVLWLSTYSAKLSSECPAILSLQNKYAPVTCATMSSTMNNATTTTMTTKASELGADATTSSANSSGGEDSRSLSSAGIAGTAVGSAAGLALLAGIVFFFVRRARRSRETEIQLQAQAVELSDANKPKSLRRQSIYEMPQPESPSELIGNTVHPVELGCRKERTPGPVYELSVEKEPATKKSSEDMVKCGSRIIRGF